MAHGNWITKQSMLLRSGAGAVLRALTAADCFGHPNNDPGFAAHMGAAVSAVESLIAGLTGSASRIDVSISYQPDTGPGNVEVGHPGGTLSVIVAERY